MFRKRTGRVQFLVLLRLWNGPPQNKQANKTNNSSEKKMFKIILKTNCLSCLVFALWPSDTEGYSKKPLIVQNFKD